jgi:glycosyltransferase involved in cell wall biosynthesis
MRVVALLATYNEERFIAACLEHLFAHDLEAYLIDNDSNDATVAIAEEYLRDGLIGIERFPRAGMYTWLPILARKAELSASLNADWFVHVDADEIRLPPGIGLTLAEALGEVDAAGYNAVNFQEFTFVPTREEPDHDHPRYLETMRWYYPFLPEFPHRLNAWKQQRAPVDLVSWGGHRVRFPKLRMYPVSFPMRHYLFLSIPHAIRKYVERVFDPAEVANGAHTVRAALNTTSFVLPAESELRRYESDELLDASEPLRSHPVFSISESVPGG